MNNFDDYIRENMAREENEIPEEVKLSLEKALGSLPENAPKKHRLRSVTKIATIAASLIAVFIFVLPNVSVTYAKACEQIPLLGRIIQVTTFREYSYSDERHEMLISEPKIEEKDAEAAGYINKSVSELTNELVSYFYEELEITGGAGYGSIYMDYEVVSNTEKWFTLKLTVSENTASSNSYFKYYHIDKRDGKIVELGDLFKSKNYSDALTENIKEQMRKLMERDSNLIYWVDDSIIGEDFVQVGADHNFYWNEQGELVIPFDKYEVAPGYMGTSEFIVPAEVTDSLLKDQYRDIFD